MHARVSRSIKRKETEEELEESGPPEHPGHAERPFEKEADGAVDTKQCERTAGRKAYRVSLGAVEKCARFLTSPTPAACASTQIASL